MEGLVAVLSFGICVLWDCVVLIRSLAPMEGLIAIFGFWAFLIALVMRKTITTYLEKSKSEGSAELTTLTQRVGQLESLVSTLNNQLTELNTNAEFTQKLLMESARKLAEAEQLLIETTNQTTILIEKAQSAEHGLKLIEATPPESSFGKVVNDQTIRFERLLPGRLDEVWKYFTVAGEASKWLAPGNIEARLGGRIELNFEPDKLPFRQGKGSRIIGLFNSFEPGHKLGFSWMDTADDLDSAVSIELSEKGNQTAVVLTHSRLPASRMHEFMASWHAHLDVLAARLANILPPDFNKRFNQVVQKYAAIVAGTIVISGTAAATLPAPAEAASTLDQNTYQTIKAERTDIMKRYDLLWRDVDEHQRRVDALKRDTSLESQRQVDQLDRQLEDEYRDLRQLELDIKELDKVLK
jgi:uncharacterized protein YndB with AHSA1/START domain/peptidoglycan hydrolase CwlO-like protein